ncbi:MAG: MotA/TolQ/ExbB proton channel family protein [Gammaproteobacteria bacterium]|jgi:biopolymer transport protein ExbB|nr:biopolymer transporter ExbB [Gammaproteobacteria bacterium]RPG52194.1 MAG: MotA/TolQ/ExbB proton channel family protein [Gammaproteobacteria bacterium TMED104]|tara:strand:- start:5396 stop:6001 length:606 start_codon:yes stop_codon:yes gene_type:complete
MIDYLTAGGWFMLPLLICSVLLISIVIERIWFLQKRLVSPEGLLRTFINHSKDQSITIQQQDSYVESSSLGELLVTAYRFKDKPRNIVEDKVVEASSNVRMKLERNLNMLGIIASISPLLGLLGTVVGMITVFANINLVDGSSNSDLLASGISEALITTAFGLLVAVPGLIFYKYFSARVNLHMLNMQNELSKFVDFLDLK